MAEVRPFRGVHYNQLLVQDLSVVICPPYDIITPQLQQELYHRSQYNFVRLEHGRELPQDTATDNKYTRSATTLRQWLKENVLSVDKRPAIYVHDHYFIYNGREYKRRGIIARVRLEDWEKRVIRPHEGTLGEPKSDRISLLRELRANTSPVLALFEDREQRIVSILATKERTSRSVISLSSNEERHEIWSITNQLTIKQLCDALAEQPLYIADGHHRYESALAYQRERSLRSGVVSGDEAFNFMIMTLLDFTDPGLIILPPHRLVRGISKSVMDGFRGRLEALFEITELPLSAPGDWQQIDDLMAGLSGIRLLLFGLMGKLLSLELRDITTASQMMPHFHSEIYKSLDVSIADHIVLEKLLGLSSNREERRITYSYDREDAVSRVMDLEYQLAFLLSPVKVGLVKAIADAGDRMPRKSTYFYPKLPSGLVFWRLT